MIPDSPATKVHKPVMAPAGPGRLWQLFHERAGVILDQDITKVAFFHPRDVRLIPKSQQEPIS